MATEPETTTTDTTAESKTFRAEVRQLLHILAHSLYTEREVFMRELISNASDALNRIQFEMLTNPDVVDPEAELAIHIAIDAEANTLTIKDRGIGMTRDEIVENLGTIAQSGARAFLQRMGEDQKDTDVIGQFGVGFYSIFMVADRVTVCSRSYRPDAEAVLWEATGGDTYTLGTCDRTERGTTIILYLKEDAKDFSNEWRIRQVIKRHSDFVAFPIFLGEERVNQEKALWRRPPREVETDQYNEFYKQLTMDSDIPMMHIHLSTDVPVDLHTIFYIPAHRERGLLERRVEGKVKLYSRKILIQEEVKDLLPTYYRFMEGVIDSEDIPLNVSRESVQSSPVKQRIRKTLTSRVTRELTDLAEKDPGKYTEFWKEFGIFIKEGIATEFVDRNDLMKLLRFNTTHAEDTLFSLEDYKSHIIEGQEEIYYVLGSDLESARLSPHLDPLIARGIEVVLMTDIMDSFMLTGLNEYEGMKFRTIDDANLTLPGEEAVIESGINDEDFEVLRARLAAILGARVKDVQASKVLRDNPSRLVSSDDMPGREFQRVQKLLGREMDMPPRTLELNRAHPLIIGLAQRVLANEQDPIVVASVEQLYDNALLLEGLHPNPAGMVPRIQALLEAAVGVKREVPTAGSET